MTKLLDRLTNEHLQFEQLSGTIVPGRYQLLEDATINNHTQPCQKGSFLCGDGTGVIRINHHSVQCDELVQEQYQASYQLAIQAMSQIVSGLDLSSSNLISPLLPSQLLHEEGELNELELLLQDILAKGHLQEISRRPRIDMRYDEQVQAIGRTKRFAPSAHRHLASHSECWQNRSFTGIQPKRILALVSEDEYNLYENQVYARLLDRLERFLNKRLLEIAALQQTIDDALALDQATHLNRRLMHVLCSIWGETFSEDQTLHAVELLEQTYQTIERQLKLIKALMMTGIYTRIPRNTQVSAQLKQTNILTHDQHYRFLFPLWDTFTKINRLSELTSEEQLANKQQQQKDYIAYCHLVIQRALIAAKYNINKELSSKECLVFQKEAHQLQLTQTDEGNLALSNLLTKKTLVFCPILTLNQGSQYNESLTTKHSNTHIRVPIVLSNGQQQLTDPSIYLQQNQPMLLTLSPLDFYVEEKLISLLNIWLLTEKANQYGKKIKQIPRASLAIAKDIDGIIVNTEKNEIQLLRPLDEKDKQTLLTSLKQNNAIKCHDHLIMIASDIDSLQSCPICHSTADFKTRDGLSFIASCTNLDCKVNYSIDKQNEQRYFQLYVNDSDKQPSFENAGRWYQKNLLTK